MIKQQVCETCAHGKRTLTTTGFAWQCKEPEPRKCYARKLWGAPGTSDCGCSHWKEKVTINLSDQENERVDSLYLEQKAREAKQAYEQLTIAQAKCTELALENRKLRAAVDEDRQKSVKYLRPTVKVFAMFMEKQLRLNDHKGRWENCTLQFLLSKLLEEMGEIGEAINNDETGETIALEAADTANILMMIVDTYCDNGILTCKP